MSNLWNPPLENLKISLPCLNLISSWNYSPVLECRHLRRKAISIVSLRFLSHKFYRWVLFGQPMADFVRQNPVTNRDGWPLTICSWSALGYVDWRQGGLGEFTFTRSLFVIDKWHVIESIRWLGRARSADGLVRHVFHEPDRALISVHQCQSVLLRDDRQQLETSKVVCIFS